MSILILEPIGLLCTFKIMMLLILIASKCITEEIKTFIGNKNVKTNMFRIQAYDSIMCGYFCIRFIGFMLAGKILADFSNLFSLNNFKRNNDVIPNYFMTIV